MEEGYIVATSTSPPSSKYLLDDSKFIFGCILKPFLPQENIPSVTFAGNEIVRCISCKGYINPYCEFMDSGTRWSCNLCKTLNNVPAEYFCNLDSQGIRIDLDKRIELTSLSIDINAPETYMSRPPMPCIFVFLIDVSIKAQENDFIGTVSSTLSSILASKVLPGYPRTEIALMFFDKSVHFVNLGSESLSIVSECDSGELFLPLPADQLLVSIEDAEEKVIRALELIKSLPSVPYSTAYRAALRSSGLILQNQGGKIMSFCGEMLCESTHPLQFTFKQSNSFYEDIGNEFAYWNISLTQFIKSSQYCNFQGLVSMSQLTGGQIYFYPNFTARASSEKLKNEVIMSATTITAWECSLKFRHSAEWRIVQSYGNFSVRPDGLLGIPVYNYPSSFAFELSPVNVSLKELYLQSALLYTNCEGERKLRIHNKKLTTSESTKDLLENANCDGLVNFICKKASFAMVSADNPELGPNMVESLAKDIVQNCVRIWGKQPESLAFFCASVLGLVKHTIFQFKSFGCKSYADNLNLDLFFYFKYLFNSMGAEESGIMIYPRLYPIHEAFSRVLNLTYQSLESKGAYLLDTGVEMFVWVGKFYVWT